MDTFYRDDRTVFEITMGGY